MCPRLRRWPTRHRRSRSCSLPPGSRGARHRPPGGRRRSQGLVAAARAGFLRGQAHRRGGWHRLCGGPLHGRGAGALRHPQGGSGRRRQQRRGTGGVSKPVLVVIDDDAAVSRDLRRRYVRDYRVLRTDSGPEALAALRELALRGDRPAVLLADHRMPDMSGVEFLEQAMDAFPEAKRVLLTAYADTEAAIQAINTVDLDRYCSSRGTRPRSTCTRCSTICSTTGPPRSARPSTVCASWDIAGRRGPTRPRTFWRAAGCPSSGWTPKARTRSACCPPHRSTPASCPSWSPPTGACCAGQPPARWPSASAFRSPLNCPSTTSSSSAADPLASVPPSTGRRKACGRC